MYFDEFLQLYTSCRIVDRVLEAWDENENEETRPGFHRKGYMGHLTRIANMMVRKFVSCHLEVLTNFSCLVENLGK